MLNFTESHALEANADVDERPKAIVNNIFQE